MNLVAGDEQTETKEKKGRIGARTRSEAEGEKDYSKRKCLHEGARESFTETEIETENFDKNIQPSGTGDTTSSQGAATGGS